jgi:hypothetical protein
VLGEAAWWRRMGREDFRALTPLLHGHVNPYGTFELDMEKRLPLDGPGGQPPKALPLSHSWCVGRADFA